MSYPYQEHWPRRRTATLDWLIRSARELPYLDDIMREVCERLNEDGVQIARATIHARVLHPQFAGATMIWRRGEPDVSLTFITQTVLADPRYLHSPIRALYEGAEAVRQRLDLPPAENEYSIYADLRALGLTDYVALPMVGSDERRHAITFATDRPGGFTTADLLQIEDTLALLAVVAESRLTRRMMRNIIDAYVGKDAGEQVLAGKFRRGAHEVIDAAIWTADLARFTELADRAPRDEVLITLETFFDVMGAAIDEHGGEILKFMGDAVMAAFRLDRPDAPARSLAAVRQVHARLKEINQERAAAGQDEIGYGLALHVGEVIYGNIGTATRLDFTVIGPAVNEAARLEHLSREIGRHVVLSAAFVERAGLGDLVPLGEHRLRGREQPMAIFGLPEEENEPWSYIV